MGQEWARAGLVISFSMGLLAPARGVELDLAQFRAASCEALAREYSAIMEVNPAALLEMRRIGSASPGGNAADFEPTEMQAPEIGTNETQTGGGDTTLAGLAAYRHAIVVVAEEKKCALPGSGPGPGAVPH